MSVQEIQKRVFKQIVGDKASAYHTFFRDLQIGQFYILMADAYSFDLGRDVDIYKIISSTQADVYKANKYNYQSLSETELSGHQPPTFPPPPPLPPTIASNNKPQNGYQSFGRVIVDELEIGRIIVNNDVVYHKSVNVAPGYQKLWSGKLSIDGINVAAYNHYRFVVNDSVYLDKRLEELIGSYDMLADVAIIAKYNSSYNDVNISGFGQDVVAIYGKN